MNKKIVFSMSLLSTFAVNLSAYDFCSDINNNGCKELLLGISNKSNENNRLSNCLNANSPDSGNERGRWSYDDCTKLRKSNDNFAIQCYQGRATPLATNPSEFHKVNLMMDRSKARYDALRSCGIQHYDSRKYTLCKFNDQARSDCKDFIKKYDSLVRRTLSGSQGTCNAILSAEAYDLGYYEAKTMINIDDYHNYLKYQLGSSQYYAMFKLEAPINLQEQNQVYFIAEPKFDVSSNTKIVQDTFKEFTTNTTGRIEVSSNADKTYTRALIYMTEQYDAEWQVDNFAKYVVGNKAVEQWFKGFDYLIWGTGVNGKFSGTDENKVLQINEYNFSGAQGAGNIYEHFVNYSKKQKDYEYIFLKNSRITPMANTTYDDYSENKREGGNLGGPSKCYNFDLQEYKSTYLRSNFFDYQNKNYYVVNDGAVGDGKQPKQYTFSIHKTFGSTKGIFEEGKTSKFSINVRPSFDNSSPHEYNTTNRAGGIYNAINFKFYADADKLFVTDTTRNHNRNTTKALRVSNLDDVYIALQNQGKPIPVRKDGTRYYITKYTMTKKLLSDANGPASNAKEETVNDRIIELKPKEGIDGLGLVFSQKSFYDLVGITKKDLDSGKLYEITFKIDIIVDDNGFYTRPLFEKNSERIVSGKQEGDFRIIVGKGQMPKVNFGTAYNPKDSDKVIKDNKKSPDTQIAGKIYTRTNNQDIYLGFNIPTKAYNEQFVRFLNNDGKDLDVVAYDEYKQLNTKNGKCDGYYPTTNPLVIKLKNKLSVGQDYRLRYEIAEYDGVTEECIPLGDNTSNSFSIRPESIEYKVNSLEKFDKNAGKVDSKYTDNNVTFTSNKDDRFGIGVAELRVSDSKAKELKFYLEDENSNQLKAPSKNPYFANFSSNGEFKIKTVFPMVTDAKIVFAENKFTINDLKEELCTNNDDALDIASANKIDKNGKINCQTPGNELQVNFIANEELGFAYNEKLGLKRDKLNILAFSDDDNDQLLFPVQLQNKVNDGRMDKYFYKKYTSDTASVTYEFNTLNINSANFNKRVINVEANLPITSNTNIYFNISGLNTQGFDTKLAALNKDEKLSGYDESLFDASEFGKVKLSLRYPKKTNNIFNQLPKFVITNKSKASFNINGTIMERTLDKNYDVAFTALKFKDISCKPSKTTNCFKDSISLGKVQFVYFDETNKEKAIKTKDNSVTSRVVYDGNLIDLASNVDYVADYGTKITTLDYQFDKKYTNQTYVKDSIKVVPTKGNSYLDANVSFTIEVDSRK